MRKKGMTDEHFLALEKYEGYFLTAVRSGWSRNPGARAIEEMDGILNEMNGYKDGKGPIRTSHTCGTCILTMLRSLGTAYFVYKEQRTAPATEEVKTEAVKSERRKRK